MSRIRTIKPEECPRRNETWQHEWALYLIEENDTGLIKVGTAWHPRRRLSTLQCGNPRHLSLKYIFVGSRSDCRFLEKTLLSWMSKDRLVGDWVSISADRIMEEINNLLGDE